MRSWFVVLVFCIFLVRGFAVDFNISSTFDFDSGVKVNTTTITDRYNISDGTLEVDFPYAEKDDNLIAYWRFEGDADDETGRHNGSVNGATYNSSGKFGGAYDFDGVDDFINVSDSDDFSFTYGNGTDKPFSVVFWAKSDNWSNTGGGLIGRYFYPNYFEWLVWAAKKYSAIGVGLYTDSSNKIGRFSSGYPNNGEWTMITVTYDGSKSDSGIHIYFNGVNVDGSTEYTAGTYEGMNNTPITLEIGRYRGSTIRYFNGSIDEVKIYNRSLSQEEIQTLYNQGLQYVNTTATWASGSLSVPVGYKLANLTLVYFGVDVNHYIDRVEILDANGSVLSTYDENIASGTSVTLTSSDFDNGFDSTAGTDFKVKVYLVGNGSSTPVIEEVYGFFTKSVEEVSTNLIVVGASGFSFPEVLVVFILAFAVFLFDNHTFSFSRFSS